MPQSTSLRVFLTVLQVCSNEVNAHLILLASFGGEAQEIKEKLGDKVSICMSTGDLPKVFERLLSSSMSKSL